MAQITLVSHNSYLFRGTVEENLRMGDPEASQAQMRDALAQVNLLAFLEGAAGASDSGAGERREFLRRPVSASGHCPGAFA